LRHFLPHIIQENYRNNIPAGNLNACAMFADLSGFTRLTDRLMRHGTDGAEELSEVLNHIFQPTVSLVYEQGGFIPYFAGDSFTAIFPFNNIQEAQAAALRVIHTAQSMISRFEREQADPGSVLSEHQIGLKVGLSAGEIHWGIVGNRRKAYYFRGAPIEACAEAQTKAGSLQIVCDGELLRLTNPAMAGCTPVDEQFSVLNVAPEFSISALPALKSVSLPDPDPEIMSAFFPREVYESKEIGEFRNVVSVFLSFEGVDSHESLNHFASVVLDQSEIFGGYFKEIDFGDKGGVMFCLFGAPVSFENNTERALEYIGAIQEELRGLESLTGARYRIGITSGQAFTGVIGSKERCQYAAVGARVNLGARLMSRKTYRETEISSSAR
jgi:class 3 adenylate cyclase